MPLSNRLSLSIAGTAAVALASLPLGITPASAARVSEGTTSSIGVVEDASNAQQFNLKTQGAFLQLVARGRPPKDTGTGFEIWRLVKDTVRFYLDLFFFSG